MNIQRTTSALGAVIEGLDLESIDDEGFEHLRDALVAYQVLFIRGQTLSDDGHRRLAARFGRPLVFPLYEFLGETDVFNVIEDRGDQRPVDDFWHTDLSYM